MLTWQILRNNGIIPADAGSTGDGPSFGAGPRDHPRGCGEHSPSPLSTAMVAGSSPRMRGARAGFDRRFSAWRIIPADAGSTDLIICNGPNERDHPRGCGEHLTIRIPTLM